MLVRDWLSAQVIAGIGRIMGGFARGRFLAASGSPASAAAAPPPATGCLFLFRFADSFSDLAGLDFHFVNLEPLDPIVGRTLDEGKMIIGLIVRLFMSFGRFFVPRPRFMLRTRMLTALGFSTARVAFVTARIAPAMTVSSTSSL
jgi:hypothetical protein